MNIPDGYNCALTNVLLGSTISTVYFNNTPIGNVVCTGGKYIAMYFEVSTASAASFDEAVMFLITTHRLRI